MYFVIENTSFLDPSVRQFQKADIPALVRRFSTDVEPFNFDASLISTQYLMYQNDSSLDIAYGVCRNDQVKF